MRLQRGMGARGGGRLEVPTNMGVRAERSVQPSCWAEYG